MEERDGTFQPGWLMPGWGNLLLVVGFAGTGVLLGERIQKQRLSIFVVGLVASGAAAGLAALLWNHIWIGMAMPLTGLPVSAERPGCAEGWKANSTLNRFNNYSARPHHQLWHNNSGNNAIPF